MAKEILHHERWDVVLFQDTKSKWVFKATSESYARTEIDGCVLIVCLSVGLCMCGWSKSALPQGTFDFMKGLIEVMEFSKELILVVGECIKRSEHVSFAIPFMSGNPTNSSQIMWMDLCVVGLGK
jgi:hypothetical protein